MTLSLDPLHQLNTIASTWNLCIDLRLPHTRCAVERHKNKTIDINPIAPGSIADVGLESPHTGFDLLSVMLAQKLVSTTLKNQSI